MSGDSKTLTIRVVGNARSAVRAMSATEAASTSLGSRMAKISRSFKNSGATLTKWGTRFTAMTAAVGYFAVKAGAPYVDSLNKIQVLTDANQKTMDRVSKTLEGNASRYAKMGQTTGDAAAGVVELVKAGLSLDKSLKAVNATMVLAKAGEMSVADASTLVSNTLNTFGMKAKDAGKIANYLANAANISSADVTDLAEAFKYVAPVAAASHVSLKTVNAVLAELSNKGIQASIAGTGLRNFFVSLQSPAGKGGQAIKSLGVDIFDAAGKARPFKDVLKDLSVAVKGVDDETRKADLRAIFGKTGLNAAQILLDGGVEALNKYEKGVSNAGAAQRLANSASKGLAGTWASLQARVTSLAQSLYREFSPAVDDILKSVGKMIDGFSNLSPTTKKIIAVFALVAAAAGPVLLVLGAIATGIGVLLSPVGAVIAAIIALAAIFGIAMAKSKGFRDMVIGLGAKLKAAVMPAISEIVNLFKTQFIPAFQAIMPIVGPIVGFLVKMLGGALVGAISGVIQVIKGVVQVIGGVFALIADLIHGRWREAWHDLVQIVKGVFNILIGAFKVWWNVGILSIFKHGIAAVLGFFKGGFARLVGEATSGLGVVRNVLKGVYRILTWPFRKSFNWLLDFVKTAFRFVRGDFGKGVSGIKGALSRLFQVITWPYRTAFNAARRIVSGGIRALVGFFSHAPSRIGSALRRVASVVKGVFRGASHWLWNAGSDIIHGLLAGIQSMIGAVTSKLSWLTSKIPDWKGPADKDATLLKPAGQLIMGGFTEGLASRFAHVRKTLGGFTRNLASAASGANLTASGGISGAAYAGGYLSGSQGGSGLTVVVQVEGNLIGEEDFAKRVTPTVRKELVKIGKRNGGKIFGNVGT